MRKRLLSILLLCCMVLTLLPTAAVAKENYTGAAATAAVTNDAHRWDTKIEITNVTDGQEYAITTGTTAPTEDWQDSGVFTGLKKNTAYTVYTRVKATDTMAASNAVTTSVKTKKAMYPLAFDLSGLTSVYHYNGSAQAPSVSYNSGYSAATVGGFTFKYEKNESGYPPVPECKLPGAYRVTIVTDNTGSEYAAGESFVGVFSISRGNLTAADFQVTGLTHDYDGNQKKATVTLKSGMEGVGTITVYYEGVTPTVYTRQTTAPTNAGNYKVSVDVTKGDYYNDISKLELGTLTINKVNYTGTVNINGAPKFGETLTAEVTDTNNTGTLTYQWYRADKTDPIGRGTTYTLVQADIGKKITCVVSSSTETGTIETTVGPIQKADGPAAPVLNLRTRTDTRILVTENSAWEYSIDNGANWQRSCLFKDLIPGTGYTIIARVKETATHKPSGNSAPLNVTTMHLTISDELRDKLRAVASAYKGEYDGKEHEAVIVDDTKMPKGWRIAGHTAGTGDDFVSQIPKIRNVSGSNLTVKTKFTHPDYVQSLIVYSYPKITPKPVTAGMIADIPSQHYTGHPIHPTPEIKDGDMVLVKGKDFTYSYDTNTSPEQGGKVTINGTGNYMDTAFKTFTIVSTITEDDLAGLNIPANLVTVKCQTTGDSKAYGRIPGGFDLSNSTPYMENGVLKAIVQLNLPAYKAKYDADTKKTHEIADLGGNPHAAFTLKYVNDKWELDGTFPNVIILVKCDGQHPQTPPYPTEENVSGLGDQIVAVLCNNVPTGQQSGKYYGLIGGGFTSTTPMLNADKVYESTITLIPSAYCNQFSGDTGIMHKVLSTQTTDGLKFVVKYDSAKKMWKPAEGVKQMAIWVTCEKHETPTPEMPMYPMADNISGLGDQIVAVLCNNVPTGQQSGKYYGLIGGGFTSTTPMLNADKVYESTITLIPSAYCNQFSGDTGIMHKVLSTQTTDGLKFVVKYDSAKKMWKPAEGVKQMAIWVTCDKHETPTPEMPMYPMADNISGLGDQIVAVLCNNVPTGQQSGKYYGLIGGGFTSTTPMLNADKVYESTITLIPSVYCNQFSGDTGIMHKVLSAQTTDGLKFVVKYDSSTKMWKPAEEVKQMAIWVTCDKHETPTPEMPMYPMADNISGLGDQIVAVLCNNVPAGQQSGKYYGLIGGGFTSTTPMLNADKVYESTITLIPSAYCNQFSGDTGIMHKVLSTQTTDGLKFVVKYDSAKKMWKPAEGVKQMAIWVTCDKHETPTPEMPMYPMADNISGLGDQIVAVLCNNVPTGQQSGKYYGLIGGGFTSTTPTLNADKVYESTITLIPSVYCNQFSGDTGIMHKVLSAQTTDGLKFVVKYDSSTKMWKPAEEVKQMAIWVTCEKHETDTPVPTEFTITFNGNDGTPSVGSMRTTNQKLTSLPTATRSGRYSFDGWYTAASGGTKITTATVFYENTTVYAHWTYIGGGGSSGGGGGYTYHTIRAISGLNGSISPSGWTSVRHGWDQTFTITPDKGYAVAKVLVDGKSVGSVKSYTFKNVTKDHTIEVVFMKANGNPQTGVFVDVAEGSYHEEAVNWAVENGITTGTGNNHFTPDGICTRAQAVTFLWRAMAE